MSEPTPREYERLVADFTRLAAADFRQTTRDAPALRGVLCRYFQRGAGAGISEGEMVDLLGVSSPSVLTLAGYTGAEAAQVLNLLPQLTDEEIHRENTAGPLWSGAVTNLRAAPFVSLSLMVQMVMRIFGVWFGVQGGVVLFEAVTSFSGRYDIDSLKLEFLVPVYLVAMAAVAWFAAPWAARWVVGKHDCTVPIFRPSLEDLYAFAFVFLGLNFVLQALPGILLWLHYAFVVNESYGNIDPFRPQTGYDLARPVIQAIAGLLCVFLGPRWARKLAARDWRASANTATGNAGRK